MRVIEFLKTQLSRGSVRVILALIVIVALVAVFSSNETADTVNLTTQKTIVQLISAQEFAGTESLSLIGTARAFTEAKVTAEGSGRVVSVTMTLGQSVQAGQVLATLENASERASVLQAEGVYEAALAAAAQSEVGVDQAKTNLQSAKNAAVSTFQSAYNTTNNVVRNSIDTFFANPDSQVPGLKISGQGLTMTLNNERVAYQTLLQIWQQKANSISTKSDLETELRYAKESIQRTIVFVDNLLTVFATQDSNGRYSEEDLQEFISNFTNLRTTLIGQQSAIDAALSGLTSAAELVQRAELSSAGGEFSAADAQVKQALGTLRAAEANLAKTILRTPISGTVNSLSIRPGDFINSFAQVAIIANNAALEIVTFVSENERPLLSIGDVVTVEEKYSGTVTEISPAVDSATRKVEVRIATEATDIVNGDTVRITKSTDGSAYVLERVLVPLSAVKFEIEDGFVFVIENGKLVKRPVILGVVRGGSVEVLEGLSATEMFVKDARGLQVDTEVSVAE